MTGQRDLVSGKLSLTPAKEITVSLIAPEVGINASKEQRSSFKQGPLS